MFLVHLGFMSTGQVVNIAGASVFYVNRSGG